MISQDIRTLYCDSNWCNVDSDGSFRLDMFETIEVKEGMVAYVDDITIQGSMPPLPVGLCRQCKHECWSVNGYHEPRR